MFQCIYTGILLDYTVERWVDNYTSVVLQTLTPSGGRSFVDEGGQLQPYTKYTYKTHVHVYSSVDFRNVSYSYCIFIPASHQKLLL